MLALLNETPFILANVLFRTRSYRVEAWSKVIDRVHGDTGSYYLYLDSYVSKYIYLCYQPMPDLSRVQLWESCQFFKCAIKYGISQDYTDVLTIYNANIHSRSQSVQLYACSATISVMKFDPQTHIASPINVVNQVFHYLSK